MFAPSTCSSVEKGCLPGDRRSAWKDRVDGSRRSVLETDHDPVAGHGQPAGPIRGEAVRGSRPARRPPCKRRRRRDAGPRRVRAGHRHPRTGRSPLRNVRSSRGASNDGADKRDLLGRRKRGHEMCTARAEASPTGLAGAPRRATGGNAKISHLCGLLPSTVDALRVGEGLGRQQAGLENWAGERQERTPPSGRLGEVGHRRGISPTGIRNRRSSACQIAARRFNVGPCPTRPRRSAWTGS